jgi:hypothetical protein
LVALFVGHPSSLQRLIGTVPIVAAIVLVR